MASNYVRYESSEQRRALDINTYDMNKATVFPYGVYSGPIMPEAHYICGEAVPRDVESHYIIDRERGQHPDHFSRYGYAHFSGGLGPGYSPGTFPGRFMENFECSHFDLPKNMAPERFYHAPNIGAFSVASDVYEGAFLAR